MLKIFSVVVWFSATTCSILTFIAKQSAVVTGSYMKGDNITVMIATRVVLVTIDMLLS